MGRGAKRKKPIIEAMDGPTPEQLARGEFGRELQIAHKVAPIKRIPVIVTLASQGKITQRQYLALNRYREIATACDRSPVKDSVGKMMEARGGSGAGLPPSALRNDLELGWLERELGALRAIARAIAVDDLTPSQWAMQQGGTFEEEVVEKNRVVIRFVPDFAWESRAFVDIRMAGERLSSAMGF